MRGLLQVMMVLLSLMAPPAFAAEQAGDAAPPASAAEAQSQEKDEGWSGTTIFLLVFIFSVLFVLSSATAMNALGGRKPTPRPGPRRQSPGERKKPEGKDRFRL